MFTASYVIFFRTTHDFDNKKRNPIYEIYHIMKKLNKMYPFDFLEKPKQF